MREGGRETSQETHMLEHGVLKQKIAGTKWDLVLFMKILNDCRPKLQQTLNKF